jgi:hypothetical protein
MKISHLNLPGWNYKISGSLERSVPPLKKRSSQLEIGLQAVRNCLQHECYVRQLREHPSPNIVDCARHSQLHKRCIRKEILFTLNIMVSN